MAGYSRRRRTGFTKRRRGTFRRRRPTFRRTVGYKRRAYKNAKVIRRVVRNMSEVKWVTDELGATILGGSSTTQSFIRFSLFKEIAQGAGKDERIGDRVRSKRISINMFFRTNPVNTPVNLIQVVRVIIFKYRGSSDYQVSPVWTDFFETAQGPVALTKPGAIEIIKQWRFMLGNEERSNYPSGKVLKYSFPWIQNYLYRDDTATTIGNPEDKAYLLIVNASEETNSSIYYSFAWRMSYTDI